MKANLAIDKSSSITYNACRLREVHLIIEPVGPYVNFSLIGVVEGDVKKMQRDLKHIDISNVPELLRIAEEVRITNQPRILRRDSEDLAVLMPVTPSLQRRVKREITEADYEAFLAAAGSWKGLVDADKLIADIYESRRISSRPPAEL